MSPLKRIALLVAYLTILGISVHADPDVRGTVTDKSGAAVSGAKVVLASGSVTREAMTAEDGSFHFAGADGGEVRVTAAGFAPARLEASSAAPVRIVLQVDSYSTVVTVVSRGTETPLSEAQQSVVPFDEKTLRDSPAFAVDDILRQAPGFALFRRSGSLTANPTSQGVSLRGIGASGASRALVLLDGVPLNDAFGGWVYWARVPRLAVQQVEILEGGASQLYGSTALSGVVSIQRSRPGQSFASLEFTGDTYSSPQGAFTGAYYGDAWGIRGNLAGYATGGYVPTVPAQRGPVDTRAASENRTADLELSHSSTWGDFALSGSYYRESRDNGTPLQTNGTELGEVGLRWQRRAGPGRLALQLFGNGQSYDQSFSAIAASRASESLTRVQHVPSQRIGGSVLWVSSADGVHRVTLGFDGQSVRGFSQELGFSGGTPTIRVSSGGEQRSSGLFIQDTLRLGARVLLTVGLRGDYWTNTDALSLSQPLATGVITRTPIPSRSQAFISPRVSGLVRLTDQVAATFSLNRSFRSPTLNELYRGFRLGNVQTNPNAALSAEDLIGGEAGVVWSRNRWNLRATGFLYEVRDPIANVTLSVTPALILRERRNLGRNQVVGAEWDGRARISSTVELRAGYQFVESTVERFSANPALEGLQLPQVPRHSFTFSSVWQPGPWSLQLQGRLHGNQFDDDQNLLPLGRMTLLDATVARTWPGNLRTFVTVQNALNDRYAIALSPVRQVGPGIVARVGMRWQWSAK